MKTILLFAILLFPLLGECSFSEVLLIKGKVAIKRMGQDDFASLLKTDTMELGDEIWVKEQSLLKMRLFNGAEMVIRPDSRLVLEYQKEDSKVPLIKVLMGNVRTYLPHQKGDKDRLAIETPHASLGVRGTEFEVFVLPEKDRSLVATYDGKLYHSSFYISGGQVGIFEENKEQLVYLDPSQFISMALEEPLDPFLNSKAQKVAVALSEKQAENPSLVAQMDFQSGVARWAGDYDKVALAYGEQDEIRTGFIRVGANLGHKNISLETPDKKSVSSDYLVDLKAQGRFKLFSQNMDGSLKYSFAKMGDMNAEKSTGRDDAHLGQLMLGPRWFWDDLEWGADLSLERSLAMYVNGEANFYYLDAASVRLNLGWAFWRNDTVQTSLAAWVAYRFESLNSDYETKGGMDEGFALSMQYGRLNLSLEYEQKEWEILGQEGKTDDFFLGVSWQL